jgi:hypothetical protein
MMMLVMIMTIMLMLMMTIMMMLMMTIMMMIMTIMIMMMMMVIFRRRMSEPACWPRMWTNSTPNRSRKPGSRYSESLFYGGHSFKK